MPTIQDIYRARPAVYRHLQPTPLSRYAPLDELLGTEVWVKHENHLPVGAFKVRGGLNLVAGLSEDQKRGGLYTASTGNHGQSIAFAARAEGIAATIVVPENANPGKVAAMRGLGAEVILHGPDFDSAREHAGELARRNGGTFVGPTDDPLIAGVGTYALEILQDLPDVDSIIVPVGAGSGACGCGIVAKAINPDIRIIGCQSAQAPAMQLSWERGEPVEAEMNSFAEGVATRVPFENTQTLMRELLDDFLLVEDDDIRRAVALMIEHTHNLVEEAGAIPLAAALQIRTQLAGRKTVLIASGGNISMDNLRAALGAVPAGT